MGWEFVDEKPSGFTFEDTPGAANQTPAVPEWGRRNPNLYGLYGAATAIPRMAGNAPQSAVNMIQSVVDAASSPVQTGKGLYELATLNPEVWGRVMANYKQRYGGIENFSNTAIEDPLGTAMDVSSVMTGGGGIVSKIPGMAKAGAAISATGKALEPLSAAKQTILRGGAKAIPDSLPQRLYQSSLKPSTALGQAERTSLLETGLKEGILPTRAGLEKLQDTVTNINREIGDQIVAGAKAGQVVDSNAIVARLDSLKNDFYQYAPNAQKYFDDIDNLKAEFLSSHGGAIPIDRAQKIKQTIYALNRKAYGELSTVAKEGNKALARGIKEEIASVFPEINTLNRRESSLIALEGEIERAVGRISNKDIVGIGSPVKGTALGSITGSHPAGVAGFLVGSVLDNPKIKAMLAIAIKRAKGGNVSPGYVKSRLAAYQASQLGQQGATE